MKKFEFKYGELTLEEDIEKELEEGKKEEDEERPQEDNDERREDDIEAPREERVPKESEEQENPDVTDELEVDIQKPSEYLFDIHAIELMHRAVERIEEHPDQSRVVGYYTWRKYFEFSKEILLQSVESRNFKTENTHEQEVNDFIDHLRKQPKGSISAEAVQSYIREHDAIF